MIQTDARIYVDTPLFAGWAKVLHVIDGEMFPIQVKLEKPDSDGHSFQRVCQDDISEPDATEAEAEAAASEYMLAKIITRDKGLKAAGVKSGSLWAVKEHMEWGYKAYHPETMQFKGIWRRKHLKVIDPFNLESVPKQPKKVKITVKVVEKPKKTKKTKAKAELPGDSEQLSLFDF